MTSISLAGMRPASPGSRDASRRVVAMEHFIGQHAEPYLRHYEKLCRQHATASTDAPERLPFGISWLWPAFILTIPWMFYRKMYMGGIILVALPVFLDHLLPGSLFLGSGAMVAVVAGLSGKSWYLEHAERRMAKAERLYSSAPAQAAYLARARGVSWSAGVFGLLIQAVTLTAIAFDLLPPNRF
jgi:hypothetical protein